jgi:uncharacterized protein (DUF362 family)
MKAKAINNSVTVVKVLPEYPSFPYDNENHPVYQSLLKMFSIWGKDPENPFSEFVKSGDTVVIKPNWVTHYNPAGPLDSLITHSSLIKMVIDFAAKAISGSGRIIIGDAPLQSCDFHKLVKLNRMEEVLQMAKRKYPGIAFELEDWRLTILQDSIGTVTANKSNEDFLLMDVGKDSFLEDIAEYSKRFRVAAYPMDLMLRHHSGGKHEYLVTRRIKDADLFINLAKMKTHMKAGITGAMKNIIGINGHKEYLPHHIKGPYSHGGDAYHEWNFFRYIHEELSDYVWDNYSHMSVVTRKVFDRILDAIRWGSVFAGGESTSMGSWSGNDTIWRTTLDLNHILYFSENAPKHVLTIVDGIIAGEGQGPLKPKPKKAGVMIVGENPAYVDSVIAALVGYNISRIPTVFHAIYDLRSGFAGPALLQFAVTLLSETGIAEKIRFDMLANLNFQKPKFWKHAEKSS